MTDSQRLAAMGRINDLHEDINLHSHQIRIAQQEIDELRRMLVRSYMNAMNAGIFGPIIP